MDKLIDAVNYLNINMDNMGAEFPEPAQDYQEFGQETDQENYGIDTMSLAEKVEAEKTKLPLSALPVIPLEIVNYYCKTFFDDEDFVYIRFELPVVIQELVIASGYYDIIDYMVNDEFYNSTNDNLSADAIMTNEYLTNLFDIVIQYNMTLDAEQTPPADFWPTWFISNVLSICDILQKYNFNMYDSFNNDIPDYYKEIYHGLQIIISMIATICEYYKDKLIISPANFNSRHTEKFMRLVNNLCIIMIHNKFKWVYYYNSLGNEPEPFTNKEEEPNWLIKPESPD